MYPIGKNVPIPKRKVGRPGKYNFAEMEVGDSFFVPNGNQTAIGVHASQRLGRGNYRTTKQDGGVRVWRTK